MGGKYTHLFVVLLPACTYTYVDVYGITVQRLKSERVTTGEYENLSELFIYNIFIFSLHSHEIFGIK